MRLALPPLAGATNLKYLAVYGTLDWNQPIDNFEFLRFLPQLEVFALWWVVCMAPYPAMLPALSLQKSKKLSIHPGNLATEEYALLEGGTERSRGGDVGAISCPRLPADRAPEGRPKGTPSGGSHSRAPPGVSVHYDGKCVIDDPDSRRFEFTGKGNRSVKCSSATAGARCREHSERYEAMRKRARALIKRKRID